MVDENALGVMTAGLLWRRDGGAPNSWAPGADGALPYLAANGIADLQRRGDTRPIEQFTVRDLVHTSFHVGDTLTTDATCCAR